ncbi:hypothetical protein GCM10022224_026400 [Nonomuraea antimicrobica]|uniref:Uncharacterized protein n=1 Tax=Nonomuraea antimicrobica TaxID=561173 RepID=A0ABP7BL16_9ACTN
MEWPRGSGDDEQELQEDIVGTVNNWVYDLDNNGTNIACNVRDALELIGQLHRLVDRGRESFPVYRAGRIPRGTLMI